MSEPKATPVSELIEMLSAPENEGGTVVFDHTPEEIGLHVMENYRDVLAALAAQSQPAATVQEVGREAQQKTVAQAVANIVGAPYDDWRHFTNEADAILARLAALTAEPAANTIKCSWCNDTGWTIGNGNVREGCLSCDAQLNMIRAAEPAAKAVSAISANWDQQPSPQPDMGSGEAIERIAQFLHDEGGFDEAWSQHTWPEHSDDTGQREGGWVKIVPSDVQAKFRDVARRLLITPSLLSPPASQSVEKDALKAAYEAGALTVHEYWQSNPGEAPRGDPEFGEAASDYAAAALSHKEEATPAPVGEQGAGLTDTERLDRLAAESWDLRCHDIPTGGGDADIGWSVIGHWMAEPRERIMGEAWTDDPRAAIDDAIRRATPATTERGRG